MRSPDSWTLRDVLRLIGFGALGSALVLFFPMVGSGSAESHKPGSDTVRHLAFETGLGITLLACVAVGVLALAVSLFVPARDD